jgi:hypothetical protein
MSIKICKLILKLVIRVYLLNCLLNDEVYLNIYRNLVPISKRTFGVFIAVFIFTTLSVFSLYSDKG